MKIETYELQNKLMLILNWLYNKTHQSQTYDEILKSFWRWFPEHKVMSQTVGRNIRILREEGFISVHYEGEKNVAFFTPKRPIPIYNNPYDHWKKAEEGLE